MTGTADSVPTMATAPAASSAGAPTAAAAATHPIGFDRERYIELQSRHIQQRRDEIGGKLYLEMGGKLFDARLFEGLDFPVGLYYEDEYTTPRIYHRAKTVVLSNSELYFYMQRENESILRGALNEKRIRDSIFVTEDRIQFLREAGYGKLIRKAVRDHYLKLRKLETAAGENPGLEESCEKLRQQRKALTRRYPLVVLGTNLKQWLWAVKHRLQS